MIIFVKYFLVLLFAIYTTCQSTISLSSNQPVPEQKSQAINNIISYFDYLVSENIIGADNLKYVLNNPNLVNPIFSHDADSSDKAYMYSKQMELILEKSPKGVIDIDKIHVWAQDRLGILEEQNRVKEEVHEETRDIYHPMNFVCIPAGTYTNSIDGRDFVIEEGVELQDAPVTQWQLVQVMHPNSVDLDEKLSDEIIINNIKMKIQADSPMVNVWYHLVKEFLKKLNDNDQDYYYDLPSVNEYEAFLQVSLGKNWISLISKHAEHSEEKPCAVKKGSYVEYDQKRVWSIVGDVWQFTRDLIIATDCTNLHLAFGRSFMSNESISSLLRPMPYFQGFKTGGLRLMRCRKQNSIRCESRSYTIEELGWPSKNASFVLCGLNENSTLSDSLHRAISIGDREWVELLLKWGESPDKSNHQSHFDLIHSPLNWAASLYGLPEIVDLLLNYGAKMPDSLLYQVVSHGSGKSEEVIKILNTHGLHVNIVNEIGATPLHWVLERLDGYGSSPAIIADFLLKNGAHVDTCDVWGRTPLLMALSQGKDNLVKVFLKYGASLKNCCPDKMVAYPIEVEIYSLLCGRSDEEMISYAKIRNYIKAIHDFFCRWQRYARYADTGLDDIIEKLRVVAQNEKQLTIRALNHLIDDKPILFNLVRYFPESSNAMEFLIELGANANGQNNDGRTLLHEALYNESSDLVDWLIRNGCDKSINIKDFGGLTPLHVALFRHNYEIIKLLLRHKADTELYDEEGLAAIHHAVNPFVMKKDFQNNINLLIQTGADIDMLTKTSNLTALMLAANSGSIEATKTLLMHNPQLNKIDINGKMALHYAASVNDEIVKLLIDAGAQINIADNEGKTPLDYAKSDDIRKLLEQANQLEKQKNAAEKDKSNQSCREKTSKKR